MRDEDSIDPQRIRPNSLPLAEDIGADDFRARQLAYWRTKLADAPAMLELPTDFPRSAARGGRIERVGFSLGNGLSKSARNFSKAHGISLHSLILGAFNIVLARYSDQADIVIAFADAARESDDILLLRNELDEEAAFPFFVKQIQTSIDEARAHAGIKLCDLAQALEREYSASHNGLAQVFCVLASSDQSQDGANDDARFAQFDLSLRVVDGGAAPCGEITYRADLFKRTSMLRMAEHFNTLFAHALVEISAPASKLSMLSPQEYRRVVFEWNSGAAEIPEACAHELFEQYVRTAPHAPALVFGEQSLSYEELNAKANRLAHFLIARGIGRDVLVGVCVKRSIEMIVALLGIMKAGGAYLPLDPSYPADRLSYMMDDARPAMLLCQEAVLDLLQGRNCDAFCLDRDWALLERFDDTNPMQRADARTLAYVIYTSGSTGKPKGVALEHRGLSNLCITQAQAFAVDPSSQVLQFASISFDAAVSETFVTLTHGACLHLIRQEALRSAYEITSLLEKSSISVVTLPPSLLAVLPKKDLPALRTLVLAGEAWSPELAKRWAPGRTMLNAYGPTEGTVCATCFAVDASIENTIPIGKPLPNVQIYILDKHMSPVAIGVPGEIYIGGAGLARGYLQRAELTAERFVPHPFEHESGAKIYRTGDKGRYLDTGNIEFLGRIDTQVKLRGYRIELGEIESALMSHHGIRDAAVMVREDHPGEKRLVAYLVGDSMLTPRQLKDHLKVGLPDYMLPQNFIFLDAMPLSPTGKLDRSAFRPPAPV